MAHVTNREHQGGIYHKMAGWLRAIPLTRRIGRWWVKNHNVRIASGVGAGLRFNISSSTPSYAIGTNEMPVQHILAQHLKAGDVFVDIGANIGFFTVIAARLVGEGGRVFAFEPVPKNAASLRRNLALNDFRQVTVFEAAISDHSGKGELRLSEWIGGAALSTTAPPPDQTDTLAVDLVTIDELLAQDKIAAPDFVKIDVEGAEMEVLQGMAKTIQVCKPIILFEIDDGNAEAFKQKATTCEMFLRAHGYQVTRLEDSYPGREWMVGHYLAWPVQAV